MKRTLFALTLLTAVAGAGWAIAETPATSTPPAAAAPAHDHGDGKPAEAMRLMHEAMTPEK